MAKSDPGNHGAAAKVQSLRCKQEDHCTVSSPAKNAASVVHDPDPASEEFFMAQFLA